MRLTLYPGKHVEHLLFSVSHLKQFVTLQENSGVLIQLYAMLGIYPVSQTWHLLRENCATQF